MRWWRWPAKKASREDPVTARRIEGKAVLYSTSLTCDCYLVARTSTLPSPRPRIVVSPGETCERLSRNDRSVRAKIEYRPQPIALRSPRLWSPLLAICRHSRRCPPKSWTRSAVTRSAFLCTHAHAHTYTYTHRTRHTAVRSITAQLRYLHTR